MNGGAYGRETKDALIEARGVDRRGNVRVFSNGDMHYTYRHCGAPEDVIFTQALFQGAAGDPAAIAAEMDKITESREATQPIKSRTGGSTFKNPPGHKAWQLIDAAGCRGLRVGDAQVSELHCNFLINLGGATAADIETLGETVQEASEGQFRRRARMGDQADRGGLIPIPCQEIRYPGICGRSLPLVTFKSQPRSLGTDTFHIPSSDFWDTSCAVGFFPVSRWSRLRAPPRRPTCRPGSRRHRRRRCGAGPAATWA